MSESELPFMDCVGGVDHLKALCRTILAETDAITTADQTAKVRDMMERATDFSKRLANWWNVHQCTEETRERWRRHGFL